MRRSPFLIVLALVAFSPLDADAGKKKKDKKKETTEESQPVAEEAPPPAPPVEEEAAPAGVERPDWVAKVDSSGEPTVVLISDGDGPKAPLRYGVTKGQKGTILMDMKMDMSMSMAGMQMPSMDMPSIGYVMDMSVDDVDGDGVMSLGTVISDIVLTGGDPALTPMLQQSLEPLKGLGGTTVMDTRGFVRSVDFDVPADAPPDVAQQLQSMEGQSGNLAVPMPEEPVGVGASWQILQVQDSQGMQFAQRTTVTLVERDGPMVRLESKVDQALMENAPALPNLPPGSSVEFTAFSSGGSGYNVQNLNEVVPVEGSADMKLAMDMIVSAEGMTQPFGMTMDLSLKLKRPDAE